MSDQTTPLGAAHTLAPQVDGDYLGYGDYADTLWARIERALQKDANGKTKLGDDPLVVGIFGEWGAGKSKLLSMVQERAAKQTVHDIAKRMQDATKGDPMTVTVPVYFQPWKYEHERHLHVPLAVHIADALKDTWKKLPADIEVLKQWCLDKTNETEALAKNLKDKKETFDKVIGFIKGAGSAIKSKAGAVVAGTADVVLVSVGVPPLASVARKKMIEAMQTESQDGDDADEGAEANDGNASKSKDKSTAATANVEKKSTSDAFKHTDDGLGFYRMHRNLHALTRPKLDKKLLDDAGIKVTPGIEFDLRINFVVFIDDLDRCLPEKAVEALELIKTVFNHESFAFVLALDEEVVERGIGHRYRDYNFQGKKPEMPITGFEYLEKIVHLPFRLPALTQAQAVHLLEQHEAKEVIPAHTKPDYVPRVWMRAKEVNKSVSVMSHSRDDVWNSGETAQQKGQINLAHMVVNCFDIYVPRKLIRTVELFHQVLSVLQVRQREGMVNLGQPIDPRLLMAFVLLQLFQPDLYRACKRSLTGFEALLQGCMAPDAALVAARPAAYALSPLTADVDLLHWALQWHGAKPPATVKSAHLRVASEMEDRNERNTSQRILLPVVERLLEHRHAQRHAFDPLRLMVQLRSLHDEKLEINSRMYFALLALTGNEGAPSTLDLEVLIWNAFPEPTDKKRPTATSPELKQPSSWSQDTSPAVLKPQQVQRVLREEDASALYAALVSSVAAEQERLVEISGLKPGQYLPEELAFALLQMVQRDMAQKSQTARVHTDGIDSRAEMELYKQRLLAGLYHLAPYLPKYAHKEWWQLVDDAAHGGELGADLKNLKEVQARALWADVRSALGAEDRFDPKNFKLPISLHPRHDATIEPIPGFVRIAKNTPFNVGSHRDKDNPFRENAQIEGDYFVARYLTTVDQYACFVDAPDFKEAIWWDTQNDEFKVQPRQWHQQLAWGSRPVCRVQ